MSLIKEVMKEKMQELEDKLTKEIPAKLDDPALKAKIVQKLNDNVNIPIINEETEGKIIEAIYESVEAVVKGVILK